MLDAFENIVSHDHPIPFGITSVGLEPGGWEFLLHPPITSRGFPVGLDSFSPFYPISATAHGPSQPISSSGAPDKPSNSVIRDVNSVGVGSRFSNAPSHKTAF
jgi:hypothetical protein